MKLVVKIFLILNLIFSGVALYIGIQVFQAREIVKARTVLLREHVNEIAENLGVSEKQPWESSAQMNEPFRVSPVDKAKDISALAASLDVLETAASARATQLQETYQEIQTTKAPIEPILKELAEAEAETSSTRNQLTSLESNLEKTQQQVQTVKDDTTTQEREVTRLENDRDSLRQQTGQIQEQVSRTEKELQLRTTEKDRIEALLAACRSTRNEDGGSGDWHEQTARILASDPDWNYVVINKGEVDVLPMYLEAFVHRGDDFIAKVRVMQIENTVSLAEIIEGTLQPGAEIQSGDTIFF